MTSPAGPRAVACHREGLDQQGKPLDRGESADGEDHDAVDDRREVLGAVAHTADALVRPPAARRLEERLSPQRRAIDLAADEDARVEPVGQHDQSVRVEAKQPVGARDLRRRKHDEPFAPVRPVAHPSGPRVGVDPACGWSRRDLLEHQQLGAVQVADDRDVRRDARRRLVDRGEVVQVQRVGIGGAGGGQRARPRRDLTLVCVVVERGEHAVRGAATVLVGRVQRHDPRRRIERVGRSECLVEGHRMDVEAGVEAFGVAECPEVGPRARDDRDVPAVCGQLLRAVRGRRATSRRGERTGAR